MNVLEDVVDVVLTRKFSYPQVLVHIKICLLFYTSVIGINQEH